MNQDKHVTVIYSITIYSTQTYRQDWYLPRMLATTLFIVTHVKSTFNRLTINNIKVVQKERRIKDYAMKYEVHICRYVIFAIEDTDHNRVHFKPQKVPHPRSGASSSRTSSL